MIQVAIVEDDPAAAKNLESYLSRYEAKAEDKFQIQQYETADKMLMDSHKSYDLMFLDIQLPGTDGMTAARRLRQHDKSVLIVFITSIAQFAIYGYEIDAVDYIVKPVSYESFSLKMKRVMRLLASNKNNIVIVNSLEDVHVFDVTKIKYIESVGHHLHYHNDDIDVDVCGKLSEMEERLADLGFALCNRCYLVNLRRVQRVEENYVIVDGERLLISRRKRREFIQKLSMYIGW